MSKRFLTAFIGLTLVGAVAVTAVWLWSERGSQPAFSSSESSIVDRKVSGDVSGPGATGTRVSPAPANLARWAYISDSPLRSAPAIDMEWQSREAPDAAQRQIVHDGTALYQDGLHWHDLPQTAAVNDCADASAQRRQWQALFCGSDVEGGGGCLRSNQARGLWYSDAPIVVEGFWNRWFDPPSPSIAALRPANAAHCYQLWSVPLVQLDDQGRAAMDVLSKRLAKSVSWLGDGQKRALGPLHYPWQAMLLDDQSSVADWLAVDGVDWRRDADYRRIQKQRVRQQQQALNDNARALWQAHGGGDALVWRIDKQQPYWPLSLRADLPLQWLFARDERLSQLSAEAGVFGSALAHSEAPVQARLPDIDTPDRLKQWLDRLLANGFDSFALRSESVELSAWPTLQRYADRVLDALAHSHVVADVFVLGELPEQGVQQALAEQGLSWLHIDSEEVDGIVSDPTGYRLGQVRSRALLYIPPSEPSGEPASELGPRIARWAEDRGFIVWQYALSTAQAVSEASMSESSSSAVQVLSDSDEWAAWQSSMASDFRFRLRQAVSGLSIAKWVRDDALVVWVSNDSSQAKVLSLTASAPQLAVLEPKSANWIALKPLRNRWEVPLAAGESRWLSFHFQPLDLPEQRRLQPVFETMMSVEDADFVNGSFETELELPASWQASDQGFSLQLTEIGGGVDVWVNGRACGSIEFAPYRLDLTSCAEPGINSLRIAMRPPVAAGSELTFLQHF